MSLELKKRDEKIALLKSEIAQMIESRDDEVQILSKRLAEAINYGEVSITALFFHHSLI